MILSPSPAEEFNLTMAPMVPIRIHFLLISTEANPLCSRLCKLAGLVICLELIVIIVAIILEAGNCSFPRLALQLQEADIFSFIVFDNEICAGYQSYKYSNVHVSHYGPPIAGSCNRQGHLVPNLCPIFPALVHTINRHYLLFMILGPLVK